MNQPDTHTPSKSEAALPHPPIERWLNPVRRFLHIESASGLVLMACTIAALALANSPWSERFLAFWHLPCTLALGPWRLEKDLLHVVNDGLMTIFFFVVGLEIKREIVAGELRNPKAAALPVIAALGGMVVPALVFLAAASLLGVNSDGRQAWAVPMATDIAFVVGVLALFGDRVPFGLKILLLSLAIVDDLGAVLLIAFVFTEKIAWGALGLAAAGFALAYTLNRLGVRRIPVYVIVGAGIWLAVLKSGVHPTIAGVLLGLLTPASAWIGEKSLLDVVDDLYIQLRDGVGYSVPRDEYLATLDRAGFATREAVSPLERLETGLHPWVAFLIMPIFALANAGVRIQTEALTDPLTGAIAAGLVLGKPIGIVLFSGVAIALGLARLPRGVGWLAFVGGACLAGIGFTMALFLAALSVPESSAYAGKLGVLIGSTLSAVIGSVVLAIACKPVAQAESTASHQPS